jgi:hypothetical protein
MEEGLGRRRDSLGTLAKSFQRHQQEKPQHYPQLGPPMQNSASGDDGGGVERGGSTLANSWRELENRDQHHTHRHHKQGKTSFPEWQTKEEGDEGNTNKDRLHRASQAVGAAVVRSWVGRRRSQKIGRVWWGWRRFVEARQAEDQVRLCNQRVRDAEDRLRRAEKRTRQAEQAVKDTRTRQR